MKLSEMPTNQAAICLADLAIPAEKIVSHPNVDDLINSSGNTSMSLTDYIKMVLQLIPVLLRDYYSELIRVVAILTGKSEEEVNKQPIKATIEDVRNFWDEELLNFFKSFARTEQVE